MSDNYELDTTKLDQLIRDIPGNIDAFLSDAADQIVSEIKDSFVSSPSAPGDPPGVVSGELKDSIEAVKSQSDGYQVIVGAPHGLFQEFGTETIAPRPFMAPVFHTWERKFGNEAAEAGIVS